MSEIACPYCGRINELHEHTNGHDRPHPGAVGMCWRCGEVAMFDLNPLGQLTQRKLTPQEEDEVYADADVQRAIAARKAALPLGPEAAIDALRGSS